MANPDPSTSVDTEALADLAAAAAAEAADHLRDAVDGDVRILATKSSATDLVTATDRAVEAQIIEALHRARPDDAILAEEHGTRTGTSGVTWIIDPIDGTTNFFYGLAGFNVCIAAMVDGAVVAGVVVDPLRRETFRATRGGGATCNGTPLAPRAATTLGDALVATGFSYVAERRRAQAEVVVALADQIRDLRRLGAAALDLCYVAAGRVDGYYESGLAAWDLAAGGLIATEAGCRVAGLHDDVPDGRLVVAAPEPLFTDLVGALRSAARDGLEVEDPSAHLGWKFGRLMV